MLVVEPAVAVAAGSEAPTAAEALATVGTLVGAVVVVAIALLRGDRVSRQARIPLLAVTAGMLLAAAVQVYAETLSDGPAPLPWVVVLGLQGPRDIRDFCAAMIPVALVAEAIRRAEARADIGRRVVAGAAGGADGVLAALRSGLRKPDLDLLPPGADVRQSGGPSAPGRRRIALATHEGAPLGVVDLPEGRLDPLVLDAAMSAARVGLEHADAVARLHAQIAQLEASRSQFVGTVEQERRRLNAQLSSGLRAPLQGLATVLAEASMALAGGDEGAARSLVLAARARLAVAHDDLRLLARGVYPAVLSQSGLAVALRALAEDAAGLGSSCRRPWRPRGGARWSRRPRTSSSRLPPPRARGCWTSS